MACPGCRRARARLAREALTKHVTTHRRAMRGAVLTCVLHGRRRYALGGPLLGFP